MPAPDSSVRTLIRPNSSWLNFDWRGIWRYSDLLVELVLRDFTAKYKQTLLGPVWFVVNPLITTVIFTVFFGGVMKVPTNGIPPLLFYLCSLLGWSYFSNVLAATGNSLRGNAGTFSKVYFPRLIPPLAVTCSCLFSLFIQILVFVIFYAYYAFNTDFGLRLHLGLSLFLLPLLIIQMAALALGVGLILSSLTAKYRDLAQLTGFLVQMWLYATPVIYPLSRIPEKWRWVAQINPMTNIVETFRYLLLDAGHFTALSYLVSFVISFIIFFFGVALYQRTARVFIDTV